jgi:hypothetical protein
MQIEFTEKNIEIICQYVIGNTTMFDLLDDDNKNLFLCYLNDSNSSSLREVITARVAKCNWSSKKHGLDGTDVKTNKGKEIKPKSGQSTNLDKNGKKQKCGGGGTFNDFTLKKCNQLKEENVDIICSLFYDSILMFVVEFPFSVISDFIENKLKNNLERTDLVRPRSVSFSHANYLNYPDLIVHYINIKNIKKTNCISKPHLKELENHFYKHERNDLVQFFK